MSTNEYQGKSAIRYHISANVYLLCGSLLGTQRLRVVLRDEVVDHLVLGDDVDDLVGQALPVADVGGDVDEGGGEARRRRRVAAIAALYGCKWQEFTLLSIYRSNLQ